LLVFFVILYMYPATHLQLKNKILRRCCFYFPVLFVLLKNSIYFVSVSRCKLLNCLSPSKYIYVCATSKYLCVLKVVVLFYWCVVRGIIFMTIESSCWHLNRGSLLLKMSFFFFFRVVLDAFQMHYCTIFELYFRFFDTSFTLKKKVFLTFWSQELVFIYFF